MSSDIILVLVVVAALAFDFTNGFHDTANAMATTIATGALKPKVAVDDRRDPELRRRVHLAEGRRDRRGRDRRRRRRSRPTVVFGGLIGAIAWNLATWWFGLPSSSSHALIGGVVGSTLVAAGQRRGRGRRDHLEGASSRRSPRRSSRASSPRSASSSSTGSSAASRASAPSASSAGRRSRRRRWSRSPTARTTRRRRWASSRLALIANGYLKGGDDFDVPTWVVVSCATAIALGTYTGGWRIIQTLGTKVVEVRPPQGFGSEAVAATVILASSHAGYPLSTTQVVSGAVTGSGVGRPGAAVNWVVARPDRRRLAADAAGRGRRRRRSSSRSSSCSAAARRARSSSASRSRSAASCSGARTARRRSSRRRRSPRTRLRPGRDARAGSRWRHDRALVDWDAARQGGLRLGRLRPRRVSSPALAVVAPRCARRTTRAAAPGRCVGV